MSGWKSTAYGQHYNHFFKDGKSKPVCGSTALFCFEEPGKPKGARICSICLGQSKNYLKVKE